MISLVIGDKGKGKTKKMMELANNESKISNGSIIYMDKSNKHMYELSNIIRLINLNEFEINSKDSFIGFIKGLISSNHDISHIFLDNFLSLACINLDDLYQILDEIDSLSEKHNIKFVISTAASREDIPEIFRKSIICRL